MPQDIVVLLKVLVDQDEAWSLQSMASELGLSASQVHYAVCRLAQVKLMNKSRSQRPEVNVVNAEEFLIHAVKYICPPERGGVTRGYPTLWAASPLKQNFKGEDNPVVWPDPDGDAKGDSLEPIHKSALSAPRNNSELYEWLVLVDAIRDGSARERKLSVEIINKRMKALK